MSARRSGQQEKGWRNRIVGTGEEAPDQLLANPANWRIHPKPQQDALGDALDDIGWIQQVVVNRQSGHLIDGHLRVSLAMRNNEPTVPVLYVDLDEGEEALALATLDPIAAMAAADKEQLDALLREVDTGSAALQEMLAGLAGQHGMYTVPSLDELEAEYGEPSERGFWPVIKVQVSPETFARWRELVKQSGQEDEAKALTAILDAVDASALGA
ncbi:MAG: hypothetical protein M0R06_20410 [Sphaerochaeta sp.]|jgi:hypothetical protein|nr:hypothetical protein [Sphaerochaeta sp.]